MKAIKKNMRNQIGLGCTDKKILYCKECGSEFSGNSGDYWDVPDNHIFTCDCLVFPLEMELVTKKTTIKYI